MFLSDAFAAKERATHTGSLTIQFLDMHSNALLGQTHVIVACEQTVFFALLEVQLEKSARTCAKVAKTSLIKCEAVQISDGSRQANLFHSLNRPATDNM